MSKIKKHSYKANKGKFLKKPNGDKVTLRRFIQEVSKDLAKKLNTKRTLERTYMIKAFEVGGLEGLKMWCTSRAEEYIGKQLKTKQDEE